MKITLSGVKRAVAVKRIELYSRLRNGNIQKERFLTNDLTASDFSQEEDKLKVNANGGGEKLESTVL